MIGGGVFGNKKEWIINAISNAIYKTDNYGLDVYIGHYGTINIAPGNTNLDPRLTPNGFGQQLHVTATEVNATIAFIKTLSGTNVYVDPKWSSPF